MRGTEPARTCRGSRRTAEDRPCLLRAGRWSPAAIVMLAIFAFRTGQAGWGADACSIAPLAASAVPIEMTPTRNAHTYYVRPYGGDHGECTG